MQDSERFLFLFTGMIKSFFLLFFIKFDFGFILWNKKLSIQMMMMMDKEEHQHQQKKTSFVHISHNYLAMCGDYHKFSLQFFHCFSTIFIIIINGDHCSLSLSPLYLSPCLTLFIFIKIIFIFVDQIRPIIFG